MNIKMRSVGTPADDGPLIDAIRDEIERLVSVGRDRAATLSSIHQAKSRHVEIIEAARALLRQKAQQPSDND